MRTILLILILTLTASCFGGKEIKWSSKNCIDWVDFKGRPQNSPAGAMSDVGVRYECKYKGDKVRFEIYSFFDKKESWAKKKEMNENSLLHEQFHFNITELYARKMRKELIESEEINSKNATSKFRKIYKKYMDQEDQVQRMYDEKTNYSRNKEEQRVWVDKIDSELKELDKYKEPVVVI